MGMFDRLRLYRLKRRYNRGQRQSSIDQQHLDDAAILPHAASHDDLALPRPPSMADIMDGSVAAPVRPSSSASAAPYHNARPGSSAGRSTTSLKARRASAWAMLTGAKARPATLESTSSNESSSTNNNKSDTLQVPGTSTGAEKKRRRQTMMQRMSAMYENPEWQKNGRGTMTQEQMQDWRIHAYIQ